MKMKKKVNIKISPTPLHHSPNKYS
jgi:hypothetical protein